MRTAFLGTSQFAVTVLERLAASPHRPVLALTRPDRPRGRGRRVAPPPVATAARQLGIELAQPESINQPEAQERLAAAQPEAVCVCAFGGLIKEPLLSEHLMLNVHPSLLPRWRGAAPIERAIMAGDEVTGVSIMRVTAGLDSGPVCAQARCPIEPGDSYGSLAAKLASMGGELLVSSLDGPLRFAEQDDALATYADKITPQDRWLHPAEPAADLARRVWALSPHIGARVELPDGGELGVLAARAVNQAAGEPGSLTAAGRLPLLACGQGGLELLEVKPPGRGVMSGEDWLRGHRL